MKNSVATIAAGLERQLKACAEHIDRDCGHHYDPIAGEFKRAESSAKDDRHGAVYQQLGWYAGMIVHAIKDLRELDRAPSFALTEYDVLQLSILLIGAHRRVQLTDDQSELLAKIRGWASAITKAEEPQATAEEGL